MVQNAVNVVIAILMFIIVIVGGMLGGIHIVFEWILGTVAVVVLIVGAWGFVDLLPEREGADSTL